jgi:hypothetical protein
VNWKCEKSIGRKIYKIENIFLYIGRIIGFLEKESIPVLPDSGKNSYFREKVQFYNKRYMRPMQEYIMFGNYL